MRRMLPYARRFLRHRRKLLAGFVCIPLGQLADVAVTLAIGDALNRLERGDPADFLGGVFALVLLYAAVWVWMRPTRFEIDGAILRIHFPLRSRELPVAELDAACLSGPALRERIGFALRVGVGGLWGGFGRLWSRRRGWIELWISRTDGLVWVERRGGLPLLLTPEDPEVFATALGAATGAGIPD